MASTPTRAVNLTRQLVAILAVLPLAMGTVRTGQLICTLHLQPSPASQTYTVRLAYRHGQRPRVTVTGPPLILHPGAAALPHVYAGDELCLYYPGQWNDGMWLAATVVPWTAEWLLHYELWLVTGTWSGGGETHLSPRAGIRQGATPLPPRTRDPAAALQHDQSAVELAAYGATPEVMGDHRR